MPSACSRCAREYELSWPLPLDRAEDAHAATLLVGLGRVVARIPAAGRAASCSTPKTDVFEEERRAPERRRSATSAFLSDLRDLKVGDLVVHVDHGIGEFVGLKQIGRSATSTQEFLELRYAGEDKLFVPVERLDLIQKYTGALAAAARSPRRHDLGERQDAVKKAMRDMAEELLKLYAARKAVPGHAFSADTHWQQEFEDAFEYDLTVGSGDRRSPTSSATWNRRRRWIACSAATSATARPKSRCAPRSRR